MNLIQEHVSKWAFLKEENGTNCLSKKKATRKTKTTGCPTWWSDEARTEGGEQKHNSKMKDNKSKIKNSVSSCVYFLQCSSSSYYYFSLSFPSCYSPSSSPLLSTLLAPFCSFSCCSCLSCSPSLTLGASPSGLLLWFSFSENWFSCENSMTSDFQMSCLRA